LITLNWKKTHLKNPAYAMSHLVFFSFWGRQAKPGQAAWGDNVFHFLDQNWENFGKKKIWYKFGLFFNFWKSLPNFL
jgi:hypothetical protein